jgi:phthalate 4,5-cis-dihydrodiol dehydrogenase
MTHLTPAPQDKLRLGIAGLGRAFTLMLPTLACDPRLALVAAFDPRATAREQFARDFNAHAYDTLEQLAADPQVQAVYLASPHQFHAEQTELLASHGKHVLVEKPMALSLEDCDRMIAACENNGVSLIVGHCHSFDTPYLVTRKLIDEGCIGRVRMVQSLNYTDFLYRPRRPEELDTAQGGGVVFSQAAHQVDVVRLVAGSPAVRVRSVVGNWDAQRPTEGAYSAIIWFEDGSFANLCYSGYGHFDSDEWCDGIGEMGQTKSASQHGQARRKLQTLSGAEEEARLKNASTYGGPQYQPFKPGNDVRWHQHFGPLIICGERGDLRPMPNGIWLYGDAQCEHIPLMRPVVPRAEVIDELVDAIQLGKPVLHNGHWAKATLEICLALLESARTQRDIILGSQKSF